MTNVFELDASIQVSFKKISGVNPDSLSYKNFSHIESCRLNRISSLNKRWVSAEGLLLAKKLATNAYRNQGDNVVFLNFGCFGQPLIVDKSNPPNLSITHSDTAVAALLSPQGNLCGIDIEPVNRKLKARSWEKQFSLAKKIATELKISEQKAITLAWTALEALAKALRIGLTAPLEIYALKEFDVISDNFIKIKPKNFPAFHIYSFLISDHFMSIATPKNLNLSRGISIMRRNYRV